MHRHYGGKVVRAQNLHLTLAFLGSVASVAVPRLTDAVASICQEPFDLILDRAGCWPQSGVGWLRPSQVPHALVALHDRLIAVVTALGVDVDSRRYSPHVTVLRRARCQMPAIEMPTPVRWSAQSFALLESKSSNGGVEYIELASWPLLSR